MQSKAMVTTRIFVWMRKGLWCPMVYCLSTWCTGVLSVKKQKLLKTKLSMNQYIYMLTLHFLYSGHGQSPEPLPSSKLMSQYFQTSTENRTLNGSMICYTSDDVQDSISVMMLVVNSSFNDTWIGLYYYKVSANTLKSKSVYKKVQICGNINWFCQW